METAFVSTVAGSTEVKTDSGVYFTMISADRNQLRQAYREMQDHGEDAAIKKRVIRSRGMRVELFVLTGKRVAR